MGGVIAHLDRPVSASGARFAYKSLASLFLDQGPTATELVIFGARADQPSPIYSLALENALLGVDAPEALIVAGRVQGKEFLKGDVGVYFALRWLLPTLPDPYAANFDLGFLTRESDLKSAATVFVVTSWQGQANSPKLEFILLPAAPAASGSTAEAQPARGAAQSREVAAPGAVIEPALPSLAMTPALLDLSTRVDLIGVAVAPQIGALVNPLGANFSSANLVSEEGIGGVAPAVAFSGMSLALNGALVATFALPQFSWEPMESTGESTIGPIECDPASDGAPLLVASPDEQQLVSFAPGPVLLNNIDNVANGLPFAAVFSLPFGLIAVIIQSNAPSQRKPGINSSFILAGGRFGTNIPRFANEFPRSPPQAPGPPRPPAGRKAFTEGRAVAFVDAGKSNELQTAVWRIHPDRRHARDRKRLRHNRAWIRCRHDLRQRLQSGWRKPRRAAESHRFHRLRREHVQRMDRQRRDRSGDH
jgi:hypothetical protein